MLAGGLASAINTVAGGGSLLSFPLLTLGFGIDPLIANATNAVCLWPGSLAGGLGYSNLLHKCGRYFRTFIWPTIAGAILGAILLVSTSPAVFRFVVPWLILVAATCVALQPRIRAWATAKGHRVSLAGGLLLQFLVSLYGGYFGAGMGIMMLGAFAFTMEGDIHRLNAVKNWLGVAINLVASVYFCTRGIVLFQIAVPLAVGSIGGGFMAARVSQRVHPEKLRVAIAVYGVGMALIFFARTLMGAT